MATENAHRIHNEMLNDPNTWLPPSENNPGALMINPDQFAKHLPPGMSMSAAASYKEYDSDFKAAFLMTAGSLAVDGLTGQAGDGGAIKHFTAQLPGESIVVEFSEDEFADPGTRLLMSVESDEVDIIAEATEYTNNMYRNQMLTLAESDPTPPEAEVVDDGVTTDELPE